MINEIKESLMKRFSIKDLGKVENYIGINIDYSKDRSKMTLSQTKYIESSAVKYNLENAKLYDTPMEANLKLEQAREIEESTKYRNLIRELLYIITGPRPDITYPVNYLSRYQSCYDATHYKYTMRILKHLYITKDLKLTYYDNLLNETLYCMVDSGYAGDNIDRKSTTGFIIRLYGNLIFWKTQTKQRNQMLNLVTEVTAQQ